MNLNKLFKTQAELDKRIVEEKGLRGQDLLDEKILALQVELGELANEWREFKFWSNDQIPRNFCKYCQFIETPHECENPLLEEYVDCLHFILSIGLELGYEQVGPSEIGHFATTTESFLQMFREISIMKSYISVDDEWETTKTYTDLFGLFLGLGSQLGFTTEQIEQAYFDKNKVNHARQANGY